MRQTPHDGCPDPANPQERSRHIARGRPTMTAAGRDTRMWDMVQSGPTDADHTVLLLPGGWCTAVFYQELMAEPALAGIRLVAVTLPGNGGTGAPQDLSVENYARLTAALADQLGCTAVVGHSMGANVAGDGGIRCVPRTGRAARAVVRP